MANILINNIYYMLTYAFQVLHQSNYDELSTEPFENIQDLFAAILAKGIAQQLKQGLHREYITQVEDLPVMRGKLEFSGTIKNQIQKKRMLTCEHDELSENNVFNQIIKTTVMLLLKAENVREESRMTLKKEMLYFASVDVIDPYLIQWNLLRFNRNNQSYRMLLSICQFVLEGLLLTTEAGAIKLAHFLDEQRMCRLYEKFILEFYRKEVPEIHASAAKIAWQLEDEMNSLLPTMQSDIMLTNDDKTLIIDAKYYSRTMQEQYGKKSLHSSNVYQIFTYVMNQDVGNTGKVAGMLLYAKTDEEITPDAEQIIMGHKISAKTLDLNCEFTEIARQLKEIAEKYFQV